MIPMSSPPTPESHPEPPEAVDPSPRIGAEQGLIRELWALLLVYGTLVVLPLLTGIACES